MKLTPKILQEQSIRRANFISLISKIKSKTEIGAKIGVHPSYVTHILTKKRGIGPYLGARIEKAFGKPSGWLVQKH
jgi:plasmid maintenance system antidote protein VapI